MTGNVVSRGQCAPMLYGRIGLPLCEYLSSRPLLKDPRPLFLRLDPKVRVRVRVRVTELVEPVLVL